MCGNSGILKPAIKIRGSMAEYQNYIESDMKILNGKEIMYTPDRVFTKDLKRLDNKLGCYYNPDHEHFVITYDRPVGKPAEIMMVENQDGAFRQPDKRDIDTLCEGDIHRTDIKTRLRKGAAYMENYRNKQEENIRASMREATLDDKIQLRNTYAKATNSGKGNSAFRRI